MPTHFFKANCAIAEATIRSPSRAATQHNHYKTMDKNILLIIADDLGKYIGCYGCQSLSTPKLDKLAASGTRFELAFASTASCSGSRSTIYTGLHTHENGQYGLNITKTHFQTWPHIDTLPKLFNQAGYQTGIIGKIHVGTEDAYPWQIREESGTRDVAWVADRCDAFFQKAEDEKKPFHLTVGFIDPHRDIKTRGGFGNHTKQYGNRIQVPEVKPEDVEIPYWINDLPETRQEFAEYYRAITRVDTGVGLILDALSKHGLDDSTLVIFTSDNGPPFINSKTTLYDAGVQLPLIVRSPISKPGVSSPNMISFIDLLPTMLDFAGLDPNLKASNSTSPSRLGRSFLPILSSSELLPESGWPHHVFGSHTFHELQNYWPTRFLRTRRYKYHCNVAWRLDFPFAGDLYASLSFEAIRNLKDKPVMIGNRMLKDYIFRPPEELYDLQEDPQEVRNLAGDAKYEGLLLEMREKLSVWQKKTLDLWLYRDGQSVVNLSRYKADGLEIPDRLDFDVEEPGTEGVKKTSLLTSGVAFSARQVIG